MGNVSILPYVRMASRPTYYPHELEHYLRHGGHGKWIRLEIEATSVYLVMHGRLIIIT